MLLIPYQYYFMENTQESQAILTVYEVKSLRICFDDYREQLTNGILNRDEKKNELVRELHSLFSQLKGFFDDFLEDKPATNTSNIFQGDMPVISEGNSNQEIGSSVLEQKTEKQKTGQYSGVASNKGQPQNGTASIDNLHSGESLSSPRFQVEKQGEQNEYFEKYQSTLKAVQILSHQRAKLQIKLVEMNQALLNLSKQKEQFGIQKKYCLDLLVKHTDKNQELESQNKNLKRSLAHYEDKCRELSDQVVEKSGLLDEIKQFLRAQDDNESSRKGHFSRESEIENLKLSQEIYRANQNIEMVTQQNKLLRQKQTEMENDMDLLLRDNQQFYRLIDDLKREIKTERNKNKELIKIQQGKKLNQMIHRQNKHLLQVNYDLSNKIYQLKNHNEKLSLELSKQEYKNAEKLSYKSPNLTQFTHDETFSNTPLNKSKFSAKGNTGQKFLPNINITQNESNDKSRYYEQSWRIEKEKNKDLEQKVGQLMEQMSAYEEELLKKRRQIQMLNVQLSDKRRSISFNQSINKSDQEGGSLGVVETNNNIEPKSQSHMFMTLKQFTQKFEPSLMDILFIMLRISELSQTMIENDNIISIFPSNVYIILDQPDRPENIHVKVSKQEQITREDMLFQSPQILTNEITTPTSSSVVWNIGMVFYYLVYKQPYFFAFEDFLDDQKQIVLNCRKFPEAEQIISMMLQRDPESRMEIKQALEQIAYQINKMFEEEQSDD